MSSSWNQHRKAGSHKICPETLPQVDDSGSEYKFDEKNQERGS